MSTNILQLLRADGSIVVNKALAKNIGLNEAIIYSELVSLFLYWDSKDKLINIPLEKNKKTGEVVYSKEKFFFCTVENLEENTTLSRKVQNKAIEKLEKLGLIIKINKKLDGQGSQTRYFTINTDVDLILSMLSDKAESRLETLDNTGKVQKGLFGSGQRDFSEVAKGTINNTNINNTKVNNTQSVSQEPQEVIIQMTDRQTEKELQAVNRVLEEQIYINDLKQSYDSDLVQEIELNIMEMYLQDRTTIKGDSKPKALIQGVINKLTYAHIEEVINKFASLETKVKNNKAYLQTMIYNAPFETSAAIKNDIKSTFGY